jgi:ABC-type uncharacterized transport system permease subunit
MQTAFLSVLIFYLIATVFYVLRLIVGKPLFSAIGFRVVLVGVVFQLTVLMTHWYGTREALFATYLDAFQISAFLLAVVFIGLCFAKKFYGSGPFFVTLIDVFCILSLTLQNPYSITSTLPGFGFLYFHLASIFLSLSVFSLGLVVAIMYLIAEHQLKSKKFVGLAARFPSLATLEEIHHKALYFGFILFSSAIITGAGYSKIRTHHYMDDDPKQILSVLSWLFFAVILNFRVRRGWLGHKAIILSLVGFVGLFFLFFIGIK